MKKKAFEKIQYDKNTQLTRIEENFFNLINGICGKPTANITLNGEILGDVSLRSGTRQGCASSPL